MNKNGYKTGTLKFTKYYEYRTFTYNQSGFDITKHGNADLLYLSKIGFVQIRIHRNVSHDIRQITITKSKSGKWFVCIVCDADNVIQIPTLNFKKAIGIDVGIKNFAYDSNGHYTKNPLNLKKMLRPLAKIQRKISKRQKGSKNHRRAVKFYQIIHERIKTGVRIFCINYLQNMQNMISLCRKIAKNEYGKKPQMGKKYPGFWMGTFTNMLDYKCVLIEVPAKNTTLDCSRCGNAVSKSLAIRIHKCNICGLVFDRDHNTAINILKNGLGIFNIKLPQELREVTPVEIIKWSVKQEKATGLSGRCSLKVMKLF